MAAPAFSAAAVAAARNATGCPACPAARMRAREQASSSADIERAQRELSHSLERHTTDLDRDSYANAPLPVLLVQQRDESSEAPDDNRNPCRRHRRHEFGLAHVLRDFRQNEQKEAGGNAAQDHLLHAAETEETQANGSGEHDHGREQEGPRQKELILQPVACRAEAGAIRHLDVSGKLPKRHGFRRGEAFAHLLERQIGCKPIAVLDIRRFAVRVDARIVELPVALLQRRAFGFDARLEMALAVEREDADAAERRALLAARIGIDDRRTVGALLPDPETTGAFL